MCRITSAYCPEGDCKWATQLYNPCPKFVATYLDPLMRHGLIGRIRKDEADLNPHKLWPKEFPSCLRCTLDTNGVKEKMRCVLHEAESTFAGKQLEAESREIERQGRRRVKLGLEQSNEMVRKELRMEEWRLEDIRKRVETEKGTVKQGNEIATIRLLPLDKCKICRVPSITKAYFYKLGSEVIKRLMLQYENSYVKYRGYEIRDANKKKIETATRPKKTQGVVCSFVDRSGEGICHSCLRGKNAKETAGAVFGAVEQGYSGLSATNGFAVGSALDRKTKVALGVDRKANERGDGYRNMSFGDTDLYTLPFTSDTYVPPNKSNLNAPTNFKGAAGLHTGLNVNINPTFPINGVTPLKRKNPYTNTATLKKTNVSSTGLSSFSRAPLDMASLRSPSPSPPPGSHFAYPDSYDASTSVSQSPAPRRLPKMHTFIPVGSRSAHSATISRAGIPPPPAPLPSSGKQRKAYSFYPTELLPDPSTSISHAGRAENSTSASMPGYFADGGYSMGTPVPLNKERTHFMSAPLLGLDFPSQSGLSGQQRDRSLATSSKSRSMPDSLSSSTASTTLLRSQKSQKAQQPFYRSAQPASRSGDRLLMSYDIGSRSGAMLAVNLESDGNTESEESDDDDSDSDN